MSSQAPTGLRLQRGRMARSVLQGLVFVTALGAPVIGFWLRSVFGGAANAEAAVDGLLWGFAAPLPLAMVFGLLCEGSAYDRLLRAGQFLVVVVVLWLVFGALVQMNSF